MTQKFTKNISYISYSYLLYSPASYTGSYKHNWIIHAWNRNTWQQFVNKMLSYRRETALQSALNFSPKVEDWNWETIFYRHY